MKLTKLFLLLASVSALVISSDGTALAALPNAPLAVTATVVANCTITTSPVAFVGYDPIVTNKTTPLDAQGTLTLTCTKGAAVHIGLDGGLHQANGSNNMVGGSPSSTLAYGLFKNSGGVNAWGNTLGSWADYTTADDLPHDVTVYGQIPGGQHVSPGIDYADTVQATVNF